MNDQDDIPLLDDLIEKGIEITLSDLGLDDDPPLRVEDVRAAEVRFEADDSVPLSVDPLAAAPLVGASYSGAQDSTTRGAADLLADNPALEQAVRRILDEHMELAWQEIRFAILQHLDRS
jgi:hypothetical protein